MTRNPESIVRELLARHGRLYAEDAGIRLATARAPSISFSSWPRC
jgi:hypothetical protein